MAPDGRRTFRNGGMRGLDVEGGRTSGVEDLAARPGFFRGLPSDGEALNPGPGFSCSG
jgi:hypothetical protein